MKSIQPKIDMSDDDFSLLSGLGVDPDEIARQAFDEWVRWLSANKRPTTLSEQEVDRLYKVFSQASHDPDLTLDRLVRDYKLPVGRSKFLLSAVRKRYPKILDPEINEMVSLITAAATRVDREGYFRFRIVEDRIFIFKGIAQNKEWGVEQLSLERSGLGQFNVRVSKDLKDELIAELKKYG